MKKLIKAFAIAAVSVLALTSCEEFLDKSPDMGLSEKDVYKDYASFRGYLDKAYSYLDNWFEFNGYQNGRAYICSISDEMAQIYSTQETSVVNDGEWLGNLSKSKPFEIGNKGDGDGGNTPIYNAYKGLRIVNRIIRDIDKVPGLTTEQKHELAGQGYFLRAWFYFNLIERYGGMPKFDKLFSGDGTEDAPRMTYHESHEWMMSDLETAYEYLPDAWDEDNTGRPNKIAALAVMSEASLYDASPLMQNDLNTIEIKEYDKTRAATAAKIADRTLKYIADHPELGYALIPGANYANIFYWTAPPYTQCEYLWYNRTQNASPAVYNKNAAFTRYMRTFWIPTEYGDGTGNDAIVYNAPTQNAVDMFEKKGADGKYYPITDPRAGYNDQDPFKDRDPRFYNNIIYPSQAWGQTAGGTPHYITLYVGGAMYNASKTANPTNKEILTGYLCKKFWWEGADQITPENFARYRTITVYVRLAEIYLNYAEASFEATGDPDAKVDGCSMSAREALNVIRQRIGVTDVVADDADAFREAVRRERGVELMFENKRWWDLRRWMIAHEVLGANGGYPIKGMQMTPTDPGHASVADKSSLDFNYEIIPVTTEQRAFGMKNYWYPFSMNDVASLRNLKQNPLW